MTSTASLNHSPPVATEAPLYRERLASYRESAPELVLLSGWSMDREVWRPLLGELRKRCHVTLIDLPGTGSSGPGSWRLEALREALLAAAPERFYVAGWSLGGNLALDLCGTRRVRGALTLAANPRFVAREGWACGMPPAEFKRFAGSVATRDTAPALARFDWLQSGGDRRLLRRCREQRARGQAPTQLPESLALLAGLDQVGQLAGIEIPVIHLYGAADRLVPAQVAAAVRRLAPGHSVASVAGAGHLLPWCAPAEIIARLDQLLGAGEAGPSPAPLREKSAVARSFGAAAAGYDSAAGLQRAVGETLAAHLPGAPLRRVLDLGCGTGHFRSLLQRRYPGAEYLGMDLAEGMVAFARAASGGGAAWLVGDAEDLPLAADSIGLVFCNLVLQWCEHPLRLASELARALVPGGSCLVATLGPATLCELRRAWAEVDGHRHVNDFAPLPALEAAFAEAGLVAGMRRIETRREWHRSALALARDLKALGAHNLNADRPAGMTGRARLRSLERAYERFRGGGGLLPATYEVGYLRLDKPR